jgi:RNA methyltransferase, TrmH family
MTNVLLKRTSIIDSRNHPSIKRIRRLHMRSERERTDLYYIEGMRFVARAVQYHVKIETLVVCSSLLDHPFARKLVREQRRAGVPVLDVTSDVLQSITLVEDPQGIGAVVRQRWTTLEHVRTKGVLCWIALQAVRSPGNLGTILRTSEAVGGAGIILLDDSIDLYAPATVRASMGSLYSQRFIRTTPAEFARWKQQNRYLLLGTSPAATIDYHAVAYRRPVVLLMGEERKGLSTELQALCDMMVRIPMVGQVDSLNLGVATSIMLYELFNQQRTLADR